MRIQNLTVRNFRSLVNVDIPLHPLNVVIGRNGSGKTALIEVLLLLQRDSRRELTEFFDDRGGFQAVLSQRNGRASSNRLEVQAEIENGGPDGDADDSGRSVYVLAVQGVGYVYQAAKESYRAAPSVQEFFAGANCYQPIDVTLHPALLPQSAIRRHAPLPVAADVDVHRAARILAADR